MSLTRANVETILVRRCGSLLTAAGLDGTTLDGTNVDLNDPIGYALREMGYTVDDITAVADDDVSSVSTANYDKLLDLSELRTLENIQGNLDEVDITLGPRKEALGQLPDRLEKRIERLEAKVRKVYGIGVGTITAGVIKLDFAEHNEDLPDET